MNKLDITIFDLLSEKDDSAYVLIDIKKLGEYINLAKSIEAEHKSLVKDVARYFDNLKAIDKYKHAHPNETNEELEISLEKEIALYRELFAKLREVGKQE